MATIDVKDAKGEVTGNIELADAIYGIEPNMPVMHRNVKAYLAGLRQGSSNTLTRGNVRGGGRKPWRQKGTGRSRQGSIRSPLWRGGGVVWGPHPRSYDQKVNRKEVKLAMRSALSAKLADGELMVVSGLNFEKPSTKEAAVVLKALGLENQRITLVVGNEDAETLLSFRNLANVTVFTIDDINTYRLIDNKCLVIVDTCLDRIEEVLA